MIVNDILYLTQRPKIAFQHINLCINEILHILESSWISSIYFSLYSMSSAQQPHPDPVCIRGANLVADTAEGLVNACVMSETENINSIWHESVSVCYGCCNKAPQTVV